MQQKTFGDRTLRGFFHCGNITIMRTITLLQ